MNADWNPWKSLVVLQVAVLLVGCGVIASIWRCVEFVIARDEQSQEEMERFHSESIAALQELASNAGMLTSADLCPVRFRLRSGGGHYIPLLGDRHGAFQLSTWTRVGLEDATSTNMDAAGTIDFGLNPPGDYQLRVRMSGGMVLNHDFEVLPGVPIDRLVYCPRSAMGDDRMVQVEIIWPAELQDAPLLAICRIDPAPFAEHEWKWEPAADWGPVFAPARPYDPQQWDRLSEAKSALATDLPALERPLIPYI